MPSLDDIVSLLTIIGILAMWFHIVALRPLKTSIDSLQDVVNKLEQAVELSMEDRRELSNKIERISAIVDTHAKRIERTESMIIECQKKGRYE